MKLTHYTDYSLRVLIYAGIKGPELSTITEISDTYAISRNHIVKVVHHLARLGHVETLRGKNGGIRLARKPADINIGSVVRQMEQNLALVECFGANNQCVLTPTCVLRSTLQTALDEFMRVLDGKTLEDLLVPRRSIEKQLEL